MAHWFQWWLRLYGSWLPDRLFSVPPPSCWSAAHSQRGIDSCRVCRGGTAGVCVRVQSELEP